jgi:alpha,alpha-trehalase
MTHCFPEIRDLAVIGDRRTAALLTTEGTVIWYCPEQFDQPSLFAALLDPDGGSWTLDLPNAKFISRRYLEDSGILETTLCTPAGELQVTDWMSMGENMPRGICRHFSAVPQQVTLILEAAPDYARQLPNLRNHNQAVQIDQHYLYASHPLKIVENQVYCSIPAGEVGWSVLINEPLSETIALDAELLESWLQAALSCWRQIANHIVYHGPYEHQVKASIRALRLLTFAETGGIIAAPTIALPEVIGGKRNYDYRYVWLRDAGMIVSALIRAGSDGIEERRFLDFICECNRDGKLSLYPFSTIRGQSVSQEETLNLTGYRGSKPVAIGNNAVNQLQLDAYGNVLLAAKLIYTHFDTREHWTLIEHLADFLAEHWHKPDHGLWEEQVQYQYTSSKVIAACGLEYIAEFAQTEAQAQRWLTAAQEIREFVTQQCMTSEGGYAAIAGSEAVDVSAALFPVWGYTAPDTPEMLATIKVLERDYADGYLYRRHLEQFDSQQEGAFLAGTFWMAQYWVMRREFQQVYAILDTALMYANDLGLFAEEADVQTGQMLGNFPQTFVHASFIGVVIDLKTALEKN